MSSRPGDSSGDDFAHAVMARHLEESRRHAAAKRVIVQYVKRIEEELDEKPPAVISELLDRIEARGWNAAQS